MNYPLKNKVSLVTGSSRGIGKAIALKLAELGSDVIMNKVKNENKALELTKHIKSLGVKSIAIKADIGEPEQIKDMFNQIKKEFGRLDILINNAAFGALAPAMRVGKFTWNMTMNLNTGGLLLCSSGFSMMQQQDSNASLDSSTKTPSINPSKIISTLIVPIAFPLTTGAGTISTITLFADMAKQTQSQPELFAAILCITVMVFISLYFAFEGLRVLGNIGMNVFTKVMGLFTLAIGVQFLITGVSAVYKNLI